MDNQAVVTAQHRQEEASHPLHHNACPGAGVGRAAPHVGRGQGQAVRGRAVFRRNARRSGDAHESAGARSGDHREWAVGLDDEITASRP